METIGQKLKAAREKQKMSMAEVAKAIRIKTQYVEAMERDEFHKLIAPVYARGFIKLYAACVQLDPAPLVRQFNRLEPFAEPAVPNPPPAKKEIQRRRTRSLLAGWTETFRKIKMPALILPPLPAWKFIAAPVKIWIAVLAAAVVIILLWPIFSRGGSAPDYKIRLPPACRWLADPPEPYLNLSARKPQNGR